MDRLVFALFVFRTIQSLFLVTLMGLFAIDRATVAHLLDIKLYDSAEYWASLLIAEKNLDFAENISRLVLYADCLHANSKYSQAKVFLFPRLNPSIIIS